MKRGKKRTFIRFILLQSVVYTVAAPLNMAGAAIILACVLIENILALQEPRRLH